MPEPRNPVTILRSFVIVKHQHTPGQSFSMYFHSIRSSHLAPCNPPLRGGNYHIIIILIIYNSSSEDRQLHKDLLDKFGRCWSLSGEVWGGGGGLRAR